MLFSGAAVDTVPIQSAEQVLTDIDTIVQAAPDAATAQTNIDAYFAAGGRVRDDDLSGLDHGGADRRSLAGSPRRPGRHGDRP